MHAGYIFAHSYQAVAADLQASNVWFGKNAERSRDFLTK